jgi:putative endonuclease
VKQPVVYILASKPYGTLYIGVASNLADRMPRMGDQADRGDESRVERPFCSGVLIF